MASITAARPVDTRVRETIREVIVDAEFMAGLTASFLRGSGSFLTPELTGSRSNCPPTS